MPVPNVTFPSDVLSYKYGVSLTAFSCAILWSLEVENDASLSAKLAEVLLTVLVELVEQAFPSGQPAATQLTRCKPNSVTQGSKVSICAQIAAHCLPLGQ
jgi:hypothetical protein